MNIVFKKLILKNFQSYGNVPTEINLDRKNVTAIYGVNNDVGDEGDSRNGCGKSVCFTALQWALSGKIEGVSSDELINSDNEKNMSVTLEFSVGDDHYEIVRGRKPNILTLSKNGKVKTLDSMANTSKAIEDILGIPFEVFEMVYILHSHKPLFFSLKPAQTRDIMESVLQIDKLSERAEAVKKMIVEAKTDVRLAERDIENAKTTIENTEKQLLSLEEKSNQFELEKKDKILSLTNRKKELSGIDFESLLIATERYEEGMREYGELERKISDNERSLISLEKERDSLKREIASIRESEESNRRRLESNIQLLKEKQDELAQIPPDEKLEEDIKKHELLADLADKEDSKHRELADIKKKISNLTEKLDFQEEKIGKLKEGVCYTCNQPHFDQDMVDAENEKLLKIADELEELQGKQDVIEKDIAALRAEYELASTDLDVYSLKDIERYRKDKTAILASISALESSLSREESSDADARIESIEGMLQEVMSKIDFTIDQMESDSELLELKKSAMDELKKSLKYSKSDLVFMRKELAEINSRIGEEEDRKNPYLDQIESLLESCPDIEPFEAALDEANKYLTHLNYVVKLLTDSKSFVRKNIIDRYIPFFNSRILQYCQELDFPHIVKINSDLTTEMTSRGKDRSPKLLSGGEKNRLNAATTAAFMDLLGTMGFKSNLLLVDELFDSALDPSGVRKTFDFLRRKVDTMFLITHKDDLSTASDERLIVEKTNGFSEIKLA